VLGRGYAATPAAIAVPPNATGISLGASLCFLDSAGAVLCSGLPPTGDTASGNVAVAATGFGGCFVKAGGAARCFGDNFYGQLGDNTTTTSLVPVEPIGLSSGVVSIAGGAWHACAVMVAGGVKCWGSPNGIEITYIPPTPTPSTPADRTGLAPGVTAVAVSPGAGVRVNSATFVRYSHACAVTGTGGVQCWGDNRFGQLGNASRGLESEPVDVTGLASGAAAITAGAGHTCALMSAGGVQCWGDNTYGQLGDGTNSLPGGPVEVTGAGP